MPSTRVPPLHTDRLLIREFVFDDLASLQPLMPGEELQEWLPWTVLSYQQLERLRQPPYGDRAIVLGATAELIGSCGYVPLLAPFGLVFPELARGRATAAYTAEVGLYWAVLAEHQRRGYATEAAQALVRYAFGELHLARLVATTTFDNAASMAVMRKLAMRIERNPRPEPPWLQVVGLLEAAPA
jgi:RimJ/RimL family protein N-acetyltransferase